RVGRKETIMLGLGIYTAATLAQAPATNWIHLSILRGVQGIGSGMFWPVATALIADVIPPGARGRSLGLFQSFAMTGIAGGPAMAAVIIAYSSGVLGYSTVDSFSVPFYIATIFGAASVAFTLSFVPNQSKRSHDRHTK